MSNPPYTLAMILCDAAWIDPSTGKKTLLGLFSALMAREFPVTIPTMCIYLAITDGHGKTPIKLRLIDAEEEVAPLGEVAGEIDFQDPRTVYEIVLQLSGVVFPREGEYRFQAFAGNEFLIERRVMLARVPGAQP